VNPPAPGLPRRPREVTLAGTQAVVGSIIALVVLINGMQHLYSAEVQDALREIVASEEARSLDLSLETARSILRYSIMGLAVLSVASLVLGFFVLRRHRASRVALTVIGAVAALVCLFGGPIGWLVAAYIAVSVVLLWSRASRAWFRDPDHRPTPPAPGQLPGRWPPPQDPRGGPPASWRPPPGPPPPPPPPPVPPPQDNPPPPTPPPQDSPPSAPQSRR
jgi:hypothetical protein